LLLVDSSCVFIEADVVVSGVVCLSLLCTFLFCVLDLYLGTAVGYSFVVIVAVVLLRPRRAVLLFVVCLRAYVCRA
jgi:uncharacterized SAM-binding protein YcdF (DUF218 family)